MRDSLTYQAILEEGREEGREEGQVRGERRLLLRLGTARFGQPDAVAQSRLDTIADIVEIERLAERMLTVSSWSELLADE
jgi:predicted transposase YdaD